MATTTKSTTATGTKATTTGRAKSTSHSSAGSTPAKKRTLLKEKRSTGSGAACWPGFERVPGTEAGAKGSCEKKDHQTAAEKKADSRAAAGSKLEKAGGSKARANQAK